ncbi:MAG: vWA domain-containing protein [Vulcanimicrobiaceae bacterium]
MSFAHPLGLLAAVGFPLLVVAAYRVVNRRRRQATFAYSNLAFVTGAFGAQPRFERLVGALALAGVTLLGVAIAGPRMALALPAGDGAAVLCIDTSGSMTARDLAPSRALAAAAAARDFIDATPPGTRIGIVSFATAANVIVPLTREKSTALDGLDRLPEPSGATAIGDALALAARQLPVGGRRAILVLTDGVNNSGRDPLVLAERIGERGVAIFTVGVGTNAAGQLIPGTDEPAGLDESTLRAIADAGHGRYVGVDNANSLRAAFTRLARETVWERRPVDIALPLALTGAGVIVLASFVALGAGLIP